MVVKEVFGVFQYADKPRLVEYSPGLPVSAKNKFKAYMKRADEQGELQHSRVVEHLKKSGGRLPPRAKIGMYGEL